jgi:8-oxo-dGTP pyrophosphatase MutT (NUDIX family)
VTEPGVFDVVSSETVYDGKIVQVRVDQVRMPGGRVAARETVGHDRAVAIVALDDEQRVVLVAQYRHPIRRRLWELPAGLLDVEGELPLAAAQRELAEETGLRANRWQVLVDVVPSPGIMDEGVRIFLARGLVDIGRQGEILHEEADLTVERVPLAAAVDGIFRGDIVNGMAVSGLLAAHLALTGERSLRPGAQPWTDSQALARGDDEDLAQPPTLSA